MSTLPKLAWDHWHIEPSSICALKCSRCPRAELPDSLLNRQLTLKFFQEQIGSATISEIKKITFCGNDGDPIYCRDFLEICTWLKQTNPSIQLVLITNGSYKSTDWWTQLAKVFDARDEIHWSIDGWDHDSNIQYRVNSNWDSIVDGITSFNKSNQSTYKIWAAIGFRFNQDHINRMQSVAQNMCFDQFQLTKSTKFGSKYPDSYGHNDHLEPTNSQLISSSFRFERDITDISNRVRPGAELKQIFFQRALNLKNTSHSGICLIGNKGVFLNSRGEFYPCCWTANRYLHNKEWHTKAADDFNLNKRTFKEIINDAFWTDNFLKFESSECQSKCTREKLNDNNHTTEW